MTRIFVALVVLLASPLARAEFVVLEASRWIQAGASINSPNIQDVEFELSSAATYARSVGFGRRRWTRSET